MRPSVLLLTLGVILFLVHSSSGLKCFYCNIVSNPTSCDKPESTTCKDKEIFCAITVDTSTGQITARDCWQQVQKDSFCAKPQSDAGECHTCNTDGCNKDMPGGNGPGEGTTARDNGKGHGNPLRSSIWMWPVTTLLAVGYLSYF